MFSHSPADDVLQDLGDKVVSAVVTANDHAREDYRVYREMNPQWAADHSERGIANWIHDRLWAHLGRVLDEVDDVLLISNGPTREIRVGTRFLVRVKRHDAKDRVRSYPTKAAHSFWAQSDTFEGLEDIRLSFGYRWNSEERKMGDALIALHDGLGTKPVWAVKVAAAESTAASPVTWAPIEPTLPQLDLSDVAAEDGEEEGRSS